MSYAGFKRLNVDFQYGEEVLLRVSPGKGIIYNVVRWTFYDSSSSGEATLPTKFPESVKEFLIVFEVSMLKWHLPDPE